MRPPRHAGWGGRPKRCCGPGGTRGGGGGTRHGDATPVMGIAPRPGWVLGGSCCGSHSKLVPVLVQQLTGGHGDTSSPLCARCFGWTRVSHCHTWWPFAGAVPAPGTPACCERIPWGQRLSLGAWTPQVSACPWGQHGSVCHSVGTGRWWQLTAVPAICSSSPASFLFFLANGYLFTAGFSA